MQALGASSARRDRDAIGSSRSPYRSPPVVYLAEDDADLRMLLSSALEDAGFEVLTASTGHEMLRLLSAASSGHVLAPDAIVMDVRMPRCSGIDVLAALRLADWTQPVVIMTGFADPVLYDRAASFGASVILDKPVDARDLTDVIDVLLRLAHAEVMRPCAATNDTTATTELAASYADDDFELEPETVRVPRSELGLGSPAGSAHAHP